MGRRSIRSARTRSPWTSRQRPSSARHIVIATRIFLPEPGAAPLRLGALVKELAARGAEVTVLTSTPPPGTRNDTEVEGVKVRRLPVVRDREGYVRGYLQYLSFDLPLLFRILSIRHTDVVVCEPPPTTGAVVRIACSIRRLPYVYFAADIWSDAAGTTSAPSPIVRGVQSIERAAIRGAANVLSVSPGVTSRLTRWVPRSQVTEVGQGVDTTIYNPSGPQQTLGGPYLVYAGTASEVHGARIFAEAFRGVLETHPDARLVYLGQGSDYPVLREIASTLSEGCMMVMGRKSPEETASWLRGSVCALASLMPGSGYEYAVPTKMYAALACGVPVVYAGPGPNRDLVEAFGLGWTADYDVASVTTAMVKALERPDTGPELSSELRAWAESHASSDLAARLAADGIWSASPSASRRQS